MLRSAPLSSRSLTRKTLSPCPSRGYASVIAICEVVAEVNHLVPNSRYRKSVEPGSVAGTAVVAVPDTSDPPVRSVIHWPDVQKRRGSREIRCAKTGRVTSSGYSSRSRAAPSVIASGQLYVADDGAYRYSRAN